MRKKRTYFHLLLLILLLALTGCQIGTTTPVIPGDGGPPNDETDSEGSNGGETVPQFGTLTGTVFDGVSGLSFWSGTATVNGKTIAIRNGLFQASNLPTGNYKVRVSKAFYHNKEISVTIKPGNNVVQVPMTVIFNHADLDLFARLVHAEARGEIYRGQVAVAASVLNRVLHHNYPNTLRGVIVQRVNGVVQYSPVADGSINLSAAPNAKNAVLDALVGWDPSNGATGFFAPAKVANRNNWVWKQTPIIDIGNHRFFRGNID